MTIQNRRYNGLASLLENAETPDDMNFPGWRLHALTGDLRGHYSVKVNANWRITFRLENGNAEIVDYQDYH
jgi:plasmid maintenance system killer/proteic killer protein, relE/parE family protein, cytotoxic translational repressor of toxin-antitoxin stability system